MKLYRCDLCDRVFSQKTPHKCYGGCFRKHCLTFTEFEDTDFEYVKKTSIVPQGALILQEQTEPKIEFMVNWKQRRYETAKDVLCNILASVDLLEMSRRQEYVGELSLKERFAKASCDYADALISELKRKDDGEEV